MRARPPPTPPFSAWAVLESRVRQFGQTPALPHFQIRIRPPQQPSLSPSRLQPYLRQRGQRLGRAHFSTRSPTPNRRPVPVELPARLTPRGAIARGGRKKVNNTFSPRATFGRWGRGFRHVCKFGRQLCGDVRGATEKCETQKYFFNFKALNSLPSSQLDSLHCIT